MKLPVWAPPFDYTLQNELEFIITGHNLQDRIIYTKFKQTVVRFRRCRYSWSCSVDIESGRVRSISKVVEFFVSS